MCRRADANPGARVGVRAARIPEGLTDRLPVSVRHCQLIPGEKKAQQEMQTFFRRVLMLYAHSFNRWPFLSPLSFDCLALLLALNVFRVLLSFRASLSSCSSVYSTRRCVMSGITKYGNFLARPFTIGLYRPEDCAVELTASVSRQEMFSGSLSDALSFQVRRAYQRRKEKQSLTRSLGYANDQSLTVRAALLVKSADGLALRLHERNQQTVPSPVRLESPKSHVSPVRGNKARLLDSLFFLLRMEHAHRDLRSICPPLRRSRVSTKVNLMAFDFEG